MRQSNAKALRREAYGDLSQRAPRQYITDGSTIRNRHMGPRAIYLALKKKFKREGKF